MSKKALITALTLCGLAVTSTSYGVEIINLPRGFKAVFSAGEMGSNWPGFIPSGQWAANPQPGCMVFGPFYSNATNAVYTPVLKFKKFAIGTRAHNECTKRDIFKSCVERDRRSRPGSVKLDIFAHVGGEAGKRVVWERRVDNQTLSREFNFNPNGSEQQLYLPAQNWPQGAAAIEIRVCEFAGVDQGNSRVDFTGSEILIQRN